jgi:hypothetical protein
MSSLLGNQPIRNGKRVCRIREKQRSSNYRYYTTKNIHPFSPREMRGFPSLLKIVIKEKSCLYSNYILSLIQELLRETQLNDLAHAPWHDFDCLQLVTKRSPCSHNLISLQDKSSEYIWKLNIFDMYLLYKHI